MKKLVVILVAFAFVAAFGGNAYADSAWAKIRMPMSSVATSQCGDSHFVFQGGNDPQNGVNLDLWGQGAHCGNPVIMGSLLGPVDNIVAGNGPCGAGFTVVLGFDKPLLDCDGDDLVIHAIGPGYCVQNPSDIQPARVYVSSHAPCSCSEPIEMDYNHEEITPLPWYYNDANWTYLGTILPSDPSCIGAVVAPTSFDFATDLNANAGVIYAPEPDGYPTPYNYGHFDDTGAPVGFDEALGGKVCWVKIVFGDLTSYDGTVENPDGYPSVIFHAKTDGIDPDPATLNVAWGNGKAKFIDAVEGLHPPPTGDLDQSGAVGFGDFTILKDHWQESACD